MGEAGIPQLRKSPWWLIHERGSVPDQLSARMTQITAQTSARSVSIIETAQNFLGYSKFNF